MDAIQLGPLLLKKSILVLLFSCLLAYLYIAIFFRKQPDTLKLMEQHFVTTAIVWILMFKFSILLFRPSIIWTNPYGMLFFTGGTKGIYLASFTSIIIFYWLGYKSGIHIKTLTWIALPAIIIIFTSYWTMMYFI